MDKQAMIYIDHMIERHLGPTLDQTSASLLVSNAPHHHISSPFDAHANASIDACSNSNTLAEHKGLPDVEIENVLGHIRTTSEYRNLVKELEQRPPPILLQKKPKKTQSFSLFDMMDAQAFGGAGAGGSLSLPPNVRDVIDCQDPKEFFEKCDNAMVQDLILGFNTTEAEVQQLSVRLHEHLLEECQQTVCDERTPFFLNLHRKWVKDCTKSEESISFAFQLVSNVILVSSNPSTYSPHIKNVVVSLKDMLECILDQWSDTSKFQKAWLEILYLWIKCSFSFGAEETHLAWAYCDTKGYFFQRCLASVNSTLMIRFVVEKTGLMAYIQQMLSTGWNSWHEVNTNVDNRSPRGVALYHSICVFKIVILNLSVWSISYTDDECLDDGVVVKASIPTLATLPDELRWVEEIDQEMKKVSSVVDTIPTCALVVNYLLRPFLVLLEIDMNLRSNGSKSPNSTTRKVAKLSNETINDRNLGQLDSYLTDVCKQGIRHILLSCARDKDLFLAVIEACKGYHTGINFKHLAC